MLNRRPGRLLFITEDFPSGLSGMSVKTRNTLELLLDQGYQVDLCCFHFEEFALKKIDHPHLKTYMAETQRLNKKSLSFGAKVLAIIFSWAPVSISRLYNRQLQHHILRLSAKHRYQAILFNGFSSLMYQHLITKGQKIFICDEDFANIFWQRFKLEPNWLKKIFYGHELIKSLIFAASTMRSLDQIWAISPDTQISLNKISGVPTRLMPNFFPLQGNVFQPQSKRIVFAGSLNWPENVEGLKWFLEHHWLKVVRAIPEAQLVVIGQGAAPTLVAFCQSFPNVVFRGYVENLKTEYRQATLAIAPIRANAGIKVKILTYLSYGLPVVSTKIAVVGLVSTAGVVRSSDQNLARIMIAVLKNQRLRVLLSHRAYHNIKTNYSQQQVIDFISQQLSR